MEISGGSVNVTATDDGINAANADLKDVANSILITNGTVTVTCSGDGLDSNGKLLIAGGIALAGVIFLLVRFLITGSADHVEEIFEELRALTEDGRAVRQHRYIGLRTAEEN